MIGEKRMLPLDSVILEDLQNITQSSVSWDKLANKTVLITGASGMIASYLCYTLLYLNDTKQMNIKVLALVRNGEKAKKHFGELLSRSDFQLLVQDVCASFRYEEQVDYIIHAASQASPRSFVSDPVGTIAANTIGTMNMLDLAVDKKAEGFLYLSTREIYGKADSAKDFIQEDDYGAMDPTLVRSCYPESKRMSETICASYAHQYGVHCKIARIAHTYGPGIAIGDGRVVGDFINNVLHDQNIQMNSDGSGVLGLTYLSDLVTGLWMVLLNFEDFVYNISNDHAIITVKDLALKLCALYPEKNIHATFQEIDPTQKAGYLGHKVGLLKSDKAVAAGWHAMISLDDGFRRTIDYYARRVK